MTYQTIRELLRRQTNKQTNKQAPKTYLAIGYSTLNHSEPRSKNGTYSLGVIPWELPYKIYIETLDSLYVLLDCNKKLIYR